jgi:hypothetical protein
MGLLRKPIDALTTTLAKPVSAQPFFLLQPAVHDAFDFLSDYPM